MNSFVFLQFCLKGHKLLHSSACDYKRTDIFFLSQYEKNLSILLSFSINYAQAMHIPV